MSIPAILASLTWLLTRLPLTDEFNEPDELLLKLEPLDLELSKLLLTS